RASPRSTSGFIPSTGRCAIDSALRRPSPSTPACGGWRSSSSGRGMRQAARHRLSDRELHEYVAEVEGHDSQVTGVVGYFYAMYRAEALARVAGLDGREVLEVGCGEGMMFEGTDMYPVQMDVSVLRVTRAADKGRRLLCADG